MKANVFALVAAGLMSSVAFAQTTSAPNNTTPAPVTGTQTVQPTTGTSSAALPTVVSAAQPSKFKFKLYTLQFMGKSAFDKGGAVPSTDNYGAVSYALNDNLTVAIRQAFGYTYANKGAAGRAIMGDTQLHLINSKIATLPGDWTLSGAGRLYLPTGETSRFKTGRQGALYAAGGVSNTYGRTDVGYTLLGLYHNNPNAGFMDGTTLKPNTLMNVEQYAEANYNISDKLAIGQTIGTQAAFYRSIPNGASKAENLYLATGLTVKPTKALSLSAFVENRPNIFDSAKPFSLYDDEDITYNMELALSM